MVFYLYIVVDILDRGHIWGLAIFETPQEMNFVLNHSYEEGRSKWIGGSTNAADNLTISYNTYLQDDSGNPYKQPA